jgi:BirA family biotin operon repressor/biotin-[acetyl-CoA-carboxylase] ligase
VPAPEPATPFIARDERFAVVGSTNDVVRGRLADGTPEVCLAIADEQSAGRGRADRRWVAPAGAGLLLSLGFRPTYLAPDRAWRLAATVSLAMADAAEAVAGLSDGVVRLKWPNDLVVETAGPRASLAGELDAARARARLAAPLAIRKLGGVLGETDGLGTGDPRVVVGIGLNVDWAASDFPPALAGSMTSLREASAGRPVDREALLEAFLERLEPRHLALRDGRFDVAGWHARQATTGRIVTIREADGRESTTRAVGVDGVSGALLVEDEDAPGGERALVAGEVVRLRLADGRPDDARLPAGV